jgi:hypothetical protein
LIDENPNSKPDPAEDESRTIYGVVIQMFCPCNFVKMLVDDTIGFDADPFLM